MEMEVLKLETCVSANPTPEITWYRNNEELPHGSRYTMLFDDKVRPKFCFTVACRVGDCRKL